jgi:small multidrug resistance pump
LFLRGSGASFEREKRLLPGWIAVFADTGGSGHEPFQAGLNSNAGRRSFYEVSNGRCLPAGVWSTVMSWVYLLIAISGGVVATSALKASEGFTRLAPSGLVAAGYAIAFYFLSLTLNTIPVGIAYAVWSGAGVVFISIIGWLFLGQSLDLPAVAGIALIIAGVLVINLLSQAAPH